MLNITSVQKRIFFNCCRQGVYFFLSLFFVLSLRILSTTYKAATFKEFGIVENIQILLLISTALSFLFLGIKSKKFRPLLFFFSSLCAFASCRELDSFFETIWPLINWKFCYLFPFIGGIYLFKNRKKIKQPLLLFCTSPAFYMMCSAMIVFIPLAQAIGNRAFITTVLPDAHDVILMRRFIEESAEILAYFLLLLSSVEFYISLIRKSK